MLGASLRVAAFILYFVAHHYYVFLIAESIDGIGTTFGNGAIDAWGVDALDDAGYEGLKDRLFSRISQLTTLGFMGSAMIGAYVADLNISWPWVLGAGGYVVAGVVGAILMHDERPRAAKMSVVEIPVQIAETNQRGSSLGIEHADRDDAEYGGRDHVRRMGAVLDFVADHVQPEPGGRRMDYRMDLLRPIDRAPYRRGSQRAIHRR